MNTQIKISKSRKALYSILLCAIFFATFGAGNFPSTIAQEVGTESLQLRDYSQSNTNSNSEKGTALSYAVADTFRFPLDGKWNVGLDFKKYNKPRFAGKHLGEDVAAAANTPLYAVANGLVRANGFIGQFMYVVVIEHTLSDGSQVCSVYGHMNGDGIIAVGTEVSKGQFIGYLDTAASFAANIYPQHEHFGIRKGGYSGISGIRGYEIGSETISNWWDPSDFILSHQGGSSLCPPPSNGIPRDTNILNNNQVTFSWAPPACDGLDYYTFRVSNHADIDNEPWIIDGGVDKNASSVSYTIPSEYNGQTLYWAIWPHNGAGYGSKGGPWLFKIDTSAPPTPPPLPTGSWNVQYFRNKELTDQCNTASFDRTFIFQEWGESAPASGCNSDNWGARFTRRVNFQGGNYTFAVEADDWGRIYVDNNLFVDKWNGASQHYEGYYVSPGNHDVRVEFADTLGGAKISAWWWGPGFDIPHDTQDPNQWYANYWINPTQWWDPFASKNEGSGILNHDWGDGSPGWDMPSDNFSAKFRRTFNFECGTYRFIMNHDDGARFWIDDVLKVDRWTGPIGYYTIDLPISQGPHLLQVDQYENGGGANISFDWQKISGCNPSAPLLQSPSNSISLAWNTDLSLSWDPSSGATQYVVNLLGGPGVDINSGWISGTQKTIGGLWPGVYTWSVTSRNDYGSSTPSETLTFIIEEPPVIPILNPDFDAWPQSGNAPFTTTMHIVDTTNITSCLWNYGDGQTGTSCASTHDHTYTNPGSYTVRLSVSGPDGSDSMTRTNYIVVGGSNPVPTVIAISPTSGIAGGAAFIMTVAGTGFANGSSIVRWKGLDRVTTFVSSTKLRANILAADLVTPGTAAITVFTTTPGGGISVQKVSYTISNRVPTVNTIYPTSGPAGGAAFILTVSGTGFVSGSTTVRWKGSNRFTTFISSTKLRANILAADLATGGTAPITVFNAAPGGGTSVQAVSYTVVSPVPTVSAISPTSGTAGGAAFILNVSGTGFVNGSSTVRWKGANRVTTFVSSTKLRASILAADLAAPGTAAITVFTAAPGGGTSVQLVSYTITNRVPTVNTIYPTSGPTGGAAFILTVSGTGFVNGSTTVRWKGANRFTTFISSTKLRASILAADVATLGTAAITVFTSAPGGGLSVQTVSYTIGKPVPTVSAISPTSGPTGGAAFIMTVAGTGFVNGSSIVRWKGTNRVTTFVSSTKLRASILAADLAAPGTAAITVFTSAPGGGTSVQAVSYTIGSVSGLPITGFEALAALIPGTHGESLTDKAGWRGTNTSCSWVGVTRLAGLAITLNLGNNQLTGGILTQLGSLPNLTDLWLSGNQRRGPMPDSLRNLFVLGKIYYPDSVCAPNIVVF